MSNSLPTEIQALQEELCLQIASSMPKGWESVRFHYEHYPTKSETHEMNTSSCVINGREQEYDLTLDAMDLLLEIKRVIEQAGQEPWTHLEFNLSADGKYKMEFLYGVPPLAAAHIAMSQEP